MKQALQCDFDGTITIGEVSRFLLEAFAEGDWLGREKEYKTGKISVQECITENFAMIKIDSETIRDFLLNGGKVRIRPGFKELLDYCTGKGIEFIITSNGLRFYIETILDDMGIDNIDIFAASCEFNPEGIKLTYTGPDGNHIENGFKESWAVELRKRGYDRIYYVGNGASDIYPARHATHVFAVDGLLERCNSENINCLPFSDLFEVIKGLEEINT
ncbi:MAG: MtnX-like HAD-IB family phosphatase [Dehalococcoidia bacterium]|jgi:2-hydroxy-3-keto-5-methylthiopentenyl-1-phosphate phosphatase